MKGKIKKIIACLVGALMAFSFTACQATGKSAYEIAVENGFKGTEQEYLASLKGADGKDAEKITVQDLYEASGFEGTLQEFIKEYLSLTTPENNDTDVIAKNILSVMSVYCSFTTQTQTGSTWWGPVYQDGIENSAGSAVIIDIDKQNGNATLITNYHVVYNAKSAAENKISESIWLYSYGGFIGYDTTTGKDESGKGIQATYVGGAMEYDIAVLQISGSELLKNSLAQKATLGSSEKLAVGEKVYVVGNAEWEGISVTDGLLSVKSEEITMSAMDGSNQENSYRVMRTSAAVNHGNSGGAMFDVYGNLIGIVNAKNVETDVENMGYALPIDNVKQVVYNLLENSGVLKRAMLGIQVSILDSYASYDEKGNLQIIESMQVYAEPTAGARAYDKLHQGDVLKSITIDGVSYPLQRRYQLNDLLLGVRLNDTIQITFERAGQLLTETLVYDSESDFTIYR